MLQYQSPGLIQNFLYYPQNRSTYQQIFPLGTWGNPIISSLNCCIPNSIEISENTEPAAIQHLNVTYQFTSNALASQACAPISGSMVNNSLSTSLSLSAWVNWADVLGAFIINLGDDTSDTNDSSGSDTDDGTVITGEYGSYWSENKVYYTCVFNMTLLEGPKPNPNPNPKFAHWKSIEIIYGIFILFVILN